METVADHLSDVSKKNNDDVVFIVNHSGGKDSMRICGDFRAGCASSRATKMWRRWRNTTRKHSLWYRTWSGRSAS